jgi:hypothetical protein
MDQITEALQFNESVTIFAGEAAVREAAGERLPRVVKEATAMAAPPVGTRTS